MGATGTLPKSRRKREDYVNDVSFRGPDIGIIDQQPSAEAVSQTTEDSFVFLALKYEPYLGSTIDL